MLTIKPYTAVCILENKWIYQYNGKPSTEDGGRNNYRNVVDIKHTSENGQCPTNHGV